MKVLVNWKLHQRFFTISTWVTFCGMLVSYFAKPIPLNKHHKFKCSPNSDHQKQSRQTRMKWMKVLANWKLHQSCFTISTWVSSYDILVSNFIKPIPLNTHHICSHKSNHHKHTLQTLMKKHSLNLVENVHKRFESNQRICHCSLNLQKMQLA